jgi:magnesium chelatase subunit D
VKSSLDRTELPVRARGADGLRSELAGAPVRASAAGFPFSAVVGMDDLKLALALNAVAPGIGGVLVRGQKGTAKSTVVRALAALLPELAAIGDCRFSCDPAGPDPDCPDGPHPADATVVRRQARLVELPIGAAEDRVVGSLDLERVLSSGVRAFEPGLLADAHRGVLYVDEVNLLHDHLVDVLLDAAAMGRTYVEREGVSVSHAARFLLVGTMNPEEGELRPQLLDRFGLTVEVAASRDPAIRVEVVRRGLAYEADPSGFAAAWSAADAELAARIDRARSLVAAVELPEAELFRIARVCAAFEVDGMRADLVTARAARAHAAWHGRAAVSAEDVAAAARLALPHRRRRDPFDTPGLDPQALDEALADPPPTDPEPGGRGPGGAGPDGAGPDEAGIGRGDTPNGPVSGRVGPADSSEGVTPPGNPYRSRLLVVPSRTPGVPGRRSPGPGPVGRTTGATRPQRTGLGGAVHLPATVRAAAPHQLDRGRSSGGPVLLRSADLRIARREGRVGNLVLFCVDASGSMGARARMGTVKAAALSLLRDAYQRRDKVGLVTFRGTGATVALTPTSSVELGAARLRNLPTGGRTPLAAGLLTARQVLLAERLRDPRRAPLLVLVTDGRANAGPAPVDRALAAARALAADGVATVVVDAESGPVRLGIAGLLGAELRAPVVRLEELTAGLPDLVVQLRTGAA